MASQSWEPDTPRWVQGVLQLGVWPAEGFGEEVVGGEASRQSEPDHWGLGCPKVMGTGRF